MPNNSNQSLLLNDLVKAENPTPKISRKNLDKSNPFGQV
jgi:hypothetical protein